MTVHHRRPGHVRRRPLIAAEELLELVKRRDERTILTSNCPVEDWGKLLEDCLSVAAQPARGRRYWSGYSRTEHVGDHAGQLDVGTVQRFQLVKSRSAERN